MKIFLILTLLFSLNAFSESKITVSGISSGAYMAQQFHTAFSSQISGVGIVTGGPFFCAKGKMIDALNRCMKTSLGLPSSELALKEANRLEALNLIDAVSNISKAKVYAISGTKDETVVQKVSDIMVQSYKDWGVNSNNILYENKLAVGHAFPTDNFGNSCATPSQSPFISNCGRDIAGEMLKHLLGNLVPKVSAIQANFYSFDQLVNFDGIDADKLSMHKTGYAYIPDDCSGGNLSDCRLHVAFHGCKQTLDDIQTTFITKAGYNGWAESNKIVVLYPQAVKNLLINNPNGCWDWWGYTGANYHNREGLQMKLVGKMVEALRSGKLQLERANLKD